MECGKYSCKISVCISRSNFSEQRIDFIISNYLFITLIFIKLELRQMLFSKKVGICQKRLRY